LTKRRVIDKKKNNHKHVEVEKLHSSTCSFLRMLDAFLLVLHAARAEGQHCH
jgi:hypothetical protein